jgi:tetratricopeptide (TPR) repeat protein
MIAFDTRASVIDINHFWRGRALINGDQFHEAIDAYTQAAKLYPEFQEAYCFRAIAYRFADQPGLAVVYHDQATALVPRDAPAYHLRALAIGTLGHYQRAIEDHTAAIGIDPS